MKLSIKSIGQAQLLCCLLCFALLTLTSVINTAKGQNPHPSSSEYQILKQSGGLMHQELSSPNSENAQNHFRPETGQINRDFCFIEHDPLTWTELPSNDDGSTGYIPLPFTFEMYGNTYNGLYVNNNGNITFNQALSTYDPDGFPLVIPMIAPMWCDVDTQYENDGEVWYYVGPNYFIASYINVQVYESGSYPWLRNTFQVVLSDGTDDILAGSNNVGFYYGDMNWTTGNASLGVGGFNGYPATVGINGGDGISYAQVGLFSQDSDDYDGPQGSEDGVHYLDNLCLEFAVGSNVNDAPVPVDLQETIEICSDEISDLSIQFTDPQIDQDVEIFIDDNGNGGVNVASLTIGNPATLDVQFTNLSAGEYTYTITAQDNGSPNATAIYDLTVIVEDCCFPELEITCPDDLILTCVEDISDINSGFPELELVDCLGNPVDAQIEILDLMVEDDLISDEACSQLYTRTWTLGTGGGQLSCQQNITTSFDDESPVFTGTEIYSIPLQNYSQTEFYQELSLSFSDNCDFTEELSGPWDDFQSGLNTGTLLCGSPMTSFVLATDQCGNNTNQVIEITYNDFEAPEITAPEDVITTCDNVINYTANDATITDNSGFLPEVTFTEELVPGLCESNYTLVYTWTAIDLCGNLTEATASITVQDFEGPAFVEVFQDIVISCEDEIPEAIMPVAVDNCADVEVVIQMDEEIIPGDCPQNYTIERTYRAFDVCGNTSIFVHTIEVLDDVAPVIEDYNIEEELPCDNLDQILISASDNCGEVSITYEDVLFSGGCLGVIQRTYTVSDECGNSSTAEQFITIIDDIAPSLSNVPEDLVISCEEFALLDFPDVQAVDNCDDDLEVTFVEEMEGDSCSFVLTRTWTAIDHCDNETTATWTIEVSDFTAPFFTNFPADLVLACGDEVPEIVLPEAEDNCDTEVEIWTTVIEADSEECEESNNLQRIFRGIDNCGNQVIAVQNVTFVEDPQIGDSGDAGEESGGIDNAAIFPNPSTNIAHLTFTANEASMFKGEIRSLDGKLMKTIFNKELSKGEHHLEFSVQDLESGIYFVVLQNNQQMWRTRVMVMK